MTKCTFCGREENYYKGINLVKNTGVVAYYCSSKCRKNAEKLGRDKRKVRWTEAFHQTRDKSRAREVENAERIAKQKEAKKEKKSTRKASK
jgi:large subunit ribosomal protein L24e